MPSLPVCQRYCSRPDDATGGANRSINHRNPLRPNRAPVQLAKSRAILWWINRVIRMTNRKEMPAVRILVGCTLAAYLAGEHVQFQKGPAQQFLSVGSISTT